MLTWVQILQLTTACLALVSLVFVLMQPARSMLFLAWGAFTASVVVAMTGAALASAPVFAIGAASTCSFWLFARAVFREHSPIGAWHLLVVGGIVAPTVVAQALSFGPAQSILAFQGVAASLIGLEKLQAMLNATILVLSFWEGVRGWNRSWTPGERRLRYTYLAVYGTVVSICVIGLSPIGSGMDDQMQAAVGTSCALAFVLVAALAVQHRRLYPATASLPDAPVIIMPLAEAPPPTQAEIELAAMIEEHVRGRKLYLAPELKVSSLARMLRAPEYKVSRAIAGVLGVANFNQYINRYRIEHAKTMLSDERDVSILVVGMESGFGSIGPFNRAFKSIVGVTPREFRACRREANGGDEARLVLHQTSDRALQRPSEGQVPEQ